MDVQSHFHGTTTLMVKSARCVYIDVPVCVCMSECVGVDVHL